MTIIGLIFLFISCIALVMGHTSNDLEIEDFTTNLFGIAVKFLVLSILIDGLVACILAVIGEI